MNGAAVTARLFVWFSVRHARRHPWRVLGVLLGVALGAAVFTSVRIAVHASLASLSQSMAYITGQAQWSVVNPGGRVDEDLVAGLLRRPMVRQASPVLSAYVQADRSADKPFLLLGIDPILDRGLRSWQSGNAAGGDIAAWSDLIAVPYTIMISPGLQRQLAWRPGEPLSLSHSHRRTVAFNVAGVLQPEGLALAAGGRVAIVDIATFQEFLGLFGQVDRIDLVLDPEAGEEAIRRLRATLPDGVVLHAATGFQPGSRDLIRAYQYNLSFLSFASLFVGMFLVYSLVALNAAERRGELAMLRSLGAAPGHLFALFIVEGVLVGLAGWLIAIPLSAMMVTYLVQGISATISTLFARVEVTRLSLSGWEVLLSLTVTIGIALLAAWQPARQAMSVSPQEAMATRRQGLLPPAGHRRLALIGLVLLAAVYPVSRLPGIGGLSPAGYLAALLLFTGFAVLAPSGLRYWGRWIAPGLLRRAGQPGFLAARQLKDGGTGSAISVGALITAVALFVALVIMIHSFRGTVSLWVAQSIAGDLYVRPKMADLNRYRDPLPAQVVSVLTNLAPPAYVVPIRRFDLHYGTFPYSLEAIDFEQYRRQNRFLWMGGDPQRIEAAFIAEQGVVVSQVFGTHTGLRVGETFRAEIDGRILERTILGIFRDYRTDGGVVYESLDYYQRRFDDDSWSMVQVNSSRRDDAGGQIIAEVHSRLLACCGQEVEMIAGEGLRTDILRIFDDTFAVTGVLLLISLVVAGLGIAVTMAVLVLQRTRRLNTLLAIGAGRGQIRGMIFWEAALIVTAGEAAGLLCGFILSYLLIHVVNLQSFGWTFLYRVDWPTLILALPLILAAALIAALPAVRLAFRHPPAELLREG